MNYDESLQLLHHYRGDAMENSPLSRIIWGIMRLLDWKQSTAETAALIHRAIELGITSFDHADIYGKFQVEEAFGKVLAEAGLRREHYQIVTKTGIRFPADAYPNVYFKHYNTGKDHILAQARRSVRLLGCEYLDVLLIHRPDPLSDADEIADAFQTLKTEGTVRHFGVSNFLPFQFNLLQSRLDFPLLTNQLRLSLLSTEALFDGTLDQAQELRRPPMIYSPVAGGKLFTDTGERSEAVRSELDRIAKSHETTAEVIAYSWILAHPSHTLPIVGSGKEERLRAAASALAVSMDRQEWFSLLAAARGIDVK